MVHLGVQQLFLESPMAVGDGHAEQNGRFSRATVFRLYIIVLLSAHSNNS